MDIKELIELILKLNWQTIVAMFAIVWIFTRDLKITVKAIEKKMDKLETKIDTLEERMFLLSTGKTLAQAILEEKMKNEEKK